MGRKTKKRLLLPAAALTACVFLGMQGSVETGAWALDGSLAYTETEVETQADLEGDKSQETENKPEGDARQKSDMAASSGKLKDILQEVDRSWISSQKEKGEEWAVSLWDGQSGACADLDGDAPMKSASVIKVFILATVYDTVLAVKEDGEALPFAENYEGELSRLLSDMITVSDNGAANTILERLGQGDAQRGMQEVNAFCQRYGFTGTKVGRKFLEQNPTGDNVTTANDCRDLLAGICQGTCVSREASEEMYALLRQQTRTWKLPAGLEGTGAVTANKTGELGGEYGDYVENDIAIVEQDGTSYVIAVLSQNLTDGGEAQRIISRISREIYEALMHGTQQVAAG